MNGLVFGEPSQIAYPKLRTGPMAGGRLIVMASLG